MRNHPTLFTIGHSNHELVDFIDMLRIHEVTMVADVRSHPYSRLHPQFRRARGAFGVRWLDTALDSTSGDAT